MFANCQRGNLTVVPGIATPSAAAASSAQVSRLSFASTGAGGAAHIGMEMVKKEAGVDLLHVPYRGSGPARPTTTASLRRAGKATRLAGNITVTSKVLSAALAACPMHSNATLPK